MSTTADLRSVARRIDNLVDASVAVAAKVSPTLTRMIRAARAAGQTVYGDPRPEGHHGAVTLHKTGALDAMLAFQAIGSATRVALTLPYAKYLIKFGILPRGGSARPVEWDKAIDKVAVAEIEARLEQGGAT